MLNSAPLRSLFLLLLPLVVLSTVWPTVLSMHSNAGVRNPRARSQNLTFIANLSPPCRTALNSDALNPNCGSTATPLPFNETIAVALAGLTANCTEELQGGDEMVRSTYRHWIEYELARELTCLKDTSTGAYCAANNSELLHGLVDSPSQIDDFTCDQCTSAAFTKLLDWQPPEVLDFISDATNRSSTILQEGAKKCNTTWLLSNTTSSAADRRAMYTAGSLLAASAMSLLLFLISILTV
ncbi:hypothetical protein THASP1DRAFT_23271 [Thamnocephalis sphaerospora]|uniref:DUF7729 domain-containing protein n=1 Tax=Thamnocephalis sphaerospora TaxID=78915 RepID=A0A4P9XTN3_9FUNG|nr:hypothetical protein THASP1DRAFT_23271 [Thamnocephalis sphaerospora]|eukprot:RKP08800.1 hypothetical protein THASP1DRAFT_23271 [Thamnocephalis sphaerospora]